MAYERLDDLGGIQWPCWDEAHPGELFLHSRLWESPIVGPPAPFNVVEHVMPVDEIPGELVDRARALLADALARGEARHPAAKHDRVAIEEIREAWRRSGGRTPRLGREDLAAIYERQLAEQNVRSLDDFQRARLGIDAERILPSAERERYLSLPDFVDIRGREVPIRYDAEETPESSARRLSSP